MLRISYILILLCGYVYGLTDEEGIQKFMKITMGCMKDHPIDVSEVLKLQQLVVPTKPEVKCLLACTYKTIGTMKSDGNFSLEECYRMAEEMKNGDEKRLANGRKLADICIKVNDEPVTDNKGCDRAALMFKCVVEHAPKLGFKVQL